MLVAVAGIDGDQFQGLEQRARFGDEFDVAALGARQDGMSMPAIGDETDSHELVTLQLLFAPQTTHGFLVGIVGNTTGYVDGWFHAFLWSWTVEVNGSD
jgi:hypothetical protein